jgi:cytochrome c5
MNLIKGKPNGHSSSINLIKQGTLIAFVILVVVGLVVQHLGERTPSAAQQAPKRGTLFVRGYIAAPVTGGKLVAGGNTGRPTNAARQDIRDIYLPGITVFLKEAGGKESKSVLTDLSGRFTLRPPKPGRYRVCWKARGYKEDCSKEIVSVTNAPVHVSTVRISLDSGEKTSVMYGKVSLKDGSRPRRFEPMEGVNAFARVELVDRDGNQIQEAYVNNFGEYMLPRVPTELSLYPLTVRAKIEDGQKEQRLLPQVNFAGAAFHAYDFIIGNTPPRLEPLAAMDNSGQRVKTARPGSKVLLTARGSDADNDKLRYKWLASAGKLDTNESSQVSWELPKEPGRYSVSVLVYDGRGGYNKSILSLRSDTRGVPFSGKVDGTDDVAVVGAEVEVNGQMTSTGRDGTFKIYVRDARRFVLNIRKQGYGLVSRIYDDSVTGGRWTMTRATVVTVDPGKAIKVGDKRDKRNCQGPRASLLDWRRFPQLAQPEWQDGKGNVINPTRKLDVLLPATYQGNRDCGPGIQVEIPPDALQDARGRRATGTVEIATSTVDLMSPEQMPGDYTVRMRNGGTRVMQSYGAGTVEVTSGGRRFNLRSGTTAKVTIPIDPSQLAAGGALPANIPILFYNEREGVWVEEGTATRQGNAYVAQVKHFSAINTDLIKTNQSCIDIQSPTLPASYKLEYTIPMGGGAAPVVRTVNIDNSAPSRHVIYNLPSNTNIVLVPINVDVVPNVPIGTFVVNTGGAQNPTNPNLPAFPYDACSTDVILTEQLVPEEPTDGEFLHGLYSFAASNLTELEGSNPAQVTAFNQATQAYYDQIDPRDKRTTFSGFLTTNNFPTGEVNVKFANSGDLGFGRDMHCTKKANTDIGGFDVACYVTNYGDITTPDSDDAIAAVAGTTPGATVAMEFSQIESPTGTPDEFDDDERVVKFYVYNPDGTQRLSANLDGYGERPIPQLCMVCHNGEYPGGPIAGPAPEPTPVFATRDDVKLGSRFLPFDLHYYTFAPAPNDKATQQAAFKSLNEDFVQLTHADPLSASTAPAINTIINEMYNPGPDQDEDFVVAGWNATALEQGMYRDVVARTCRTCHAANVSPDLVFDQSSQVKNLLGPTELRVCTHHVMPHAKATHEIFWASTGPHMPAQLQIFGDTFTTGADGWLGTRCGVFVPGGSTPVSFYQSTIQPIWDANCTLCHVGGSPPAGLNLSSAVSFAQLVNVAATQPNSMNRITPNSTANSYLFHKIQGTQNTVPGGSGARMPFGCTAANNDCLNATDVGAIQAWINSGAPGP